MSIHVHVAFIFYTTNLSHFSNNCPLIDQQVSFHKKCSNCSKNKDIKVDLEVPSLPTLEEKKKDKKEKRKAERHLVSQPKHETPPPKDPEVI